VKVPVLGIVGLAYDSDQVEAGLVQEPVIAQEPAVHLAPRVPVYPVLHLGTQDDPEGVEVAQFPGPALEMLGAEQELGEQEPPITQEPVLHLALRVPVYPVLHLGTQEDPEGVDEAQFPGPPLVMPGAEQALGVQVPVVDQEPELQVAVRVPVYPPLQVGTQDPPETVVATQFPGPALEMEGREVHEGGGGGVAVQEPVTDQEPAVQVAFRVPV